jgi:CTP synthase (UTP-ammonia lyase)
MPARDSPVVAILGDRGPQITHRELDALIPRLRSEAGVAVRWVATDSGLDVTGFDGLWLAPGAPYRSDEAVFAAIAAARTDGIPYFGACGGMQYAVIEYTRNVLGRSATHAESDGTRDDNVVTALACSLFGEERLVTPIAGTRFAGIAPSPFTGMHFCNYAPTPEIVADLEASGVVVSATAEDAGAEVLEFPKHPFFFTSMFQPQMGASIGAPIHPLILEFVEAARQRADMVRAP